jgi:hypothetical protein
LSWSALFLETIKGYDLNFASAGGSDASAAREMLLVVSRLRRIDMDGALPGRGTEGFAGVRTDKVDYTLN